MAINELNEFSINRKDAPDSILIVDDDPTIRLYLRTLLGTVVTDVREAATGRIALAVVSHAPPEVILLDHQLPDMDGLDILKRLRAVGYAGAIVVVTGHEDPALMLRYWRAGADDFIPKGPTMDRATVTDALCRVTYRVRHVRELFQARQRAQEAHERLVDALNALDDGIAFFRRPINGERRIELSNRKFDEIYRHMTMTPWRADPPAGPCNAALDRLCEPLPDVELRTMPGGRTIRVTERPAGDGGVIHISTDVTELVAARDAAESASRAKSRFVGMVSHELRTPLSVILGLLEMMQDENHFPPQDRAVQWCRQCFQSAEQLRFLVDDLLDITRIEAGQLRLQCNPTSPISLITDLITQMAPQAHAKGLGLRFEPPRRQADLDVSADARRLRQVLWNLIGNAVKFTSSGEIVVGVQRNGSDVELWVRDTGPGIAPADQSRIFQLFERVDQASDPVDGVGLGLPITLRLVEAHGGRLALESVAGRGTTFRILLPGVRHSLDRL